MKFSLRLAASVLLIALLLAFVVDAGEVIAIVQTTAPAYLALAVLVVTIDRTLIAYKWTLLLKAQGVHPPLWHAVAIYCTSMVWGLALPATVGADAIRAVMVTSAATTAPTSSHPSSWSGVVGFVIALGIAGIAPEAALAIAISGRLVQSVAFLPWWTVYTVQSARVNEARDAAVRRA